MVGAGLRRLLFEASLAGGLRRTFRARGAIDSLVGGSLHGWAWIPGRDAPVRVDLLHEDTVLVRDFPATAMREDLAAAGHPTGACGFCIPIPGGVLPRSGQLTLLDAETGAQLVRIPVDRVPHMADSVLNRASHAPTLSAPGDHAPAVLSEPADISGPVVPDGAKIDGPTSQAPRVSRPGPAYAGKLERHSAGVLHGWAVNRHDLGQTFAVDLIVDGLVFDRQANTHARADLERNLRTPGGHGGVRFQLPPCLVADRAQVICQLRLPDGSMSAGLAVQQTGVTMEVAACNRTPEVAIVVPVYGALAEAQECLRLLERHTTRNARLIVIDDASPDPLVGKALQALAGRPGVTLLRNERNLGFSATCNRGIEEAGRADVVLLNSDARVQPRWLEGLIAAAYCRDSVGTATPLSDRAGAFSAPEIGNGNRLPPGVSERDFAIALHRRGGAQYLSVPTGNGFCLYIRRDCLDAVGKLDAEAFPRGYGEENDFCMRAWREGWEHVVADRTYVFHERNVSFGEAKGPLIAQGRAIIDKRYPEYGRAISIFRESVPLKSVRFQARLAERDCVSPAQVRPRCLFVVSTRSGGTPQTNRDLMGALEDAVEPWVLSVRGADMHLSLYSPREERLIRRHRLQEPVEPLRHRSSEYERVLRNWLAEFAFDLVHVRHMAWHSVELPRLARESGATVIFSFHDYYALCPTVKLIDGDGNFCGGRCSSGATRCRPEIWENPEIFPELRGAWVHRWRTLMGDALRECDAFVTTSPSTRERILANLPEISADRFHVIPHGRDFSRFVRSGEAPGRRLKILVPGNIDTAKGADVIRQLVDLDQDGRLEFHIVGRSIMEPSERVILHGAYERDHFVEKIRSIGAHVGVVFSIWDETWCHTLTELWSAGLPAAVLDFATVSGRVRESGAGWVLPHDDIDAVLQALVRLCLDEQEWLDRFAKVLRWQRVAPAQSTALMAARYLKVYRAARARHMAGAMPFATGESRSVESAACQVVAVVCPSNEALDEAPGSTWVRIWERTRNDLDRTVSYVRMRACDLAPAVRAGEVRDAIVQRNALSREDWEALRPLVQEGRLRYVLDLDDDLFVVPDDKDAGGVYRAYAPVLEDIAAHASLLTVSTESLARRMKDRNGNVTILPNRLSARLWAGTRVPRRADGRFRALYYGSSTHEGDLKSILPALTKFRQAHPDFRLRLIEAVSPEYAATLPDWIEVLRPEGAGRNYPDFVAWLRAQAEHCDLGLCPLEDTEFNGHKSPLKLLEMAAIGLPVLASDHPVYADLARQAPSADLVGGSPSKWVTALERCHARRDQLPSEGLEMQRWVMGQFNLRHDIDDLVKSCFHRHSEEVFGVDAKKSA